MHRRRARNPNEVVIDFSSSNTGSISVNSSFGSIGFTTSSENDQENSVPGVIYKNSDQTPKNGTNTERTPLKKGPRRVKRPQLTLEEKEASKQAKVAEKEAKKQAKVAEKEAAKLEAAEKKNLEKEIRKADALAKKEAAKLEAAEKKKLEKEIREADALAKKALDKEAKKIQVAAKATKKIEDRAKRNIEIAVEKTQNLKRKAALSSTGKPSEKKKKELPLAEKAVMADDQSLIP